MTNETMTLQSRSFPVDLARRLDTIAASLGVTRARLLPALLGYALDNINTQGEAPRPDNYSRLIERYERGDYTPK